MRVLVTGATGFIGTPLCHRLANDGHHVVAMYRNPDRRADLQHEHISLIRGDITSTSDVRTAMRDCDHCFHLAALAKPWARVPSQFEEVNVEGTRRVFAAALASNIKRVVFTSTASVFGPASISNPVTETSPLATSFDSDYERSKRTCEDVVKEFQAQGLDIVTVYPSRVFGPGPLNGSNSLTGTFRRFAIRKWRVIPGDGNAVGNYVFIDDVVNGHVLAMFESPPDQRYLLGGENRSYNQIVDHLRAATGNGQRLIHLPKFVLSIIARSQVLAARMFGTAPRITPSFVNKYLKDWHLDCRKAKIEIGYAPISFNDGLKRTVDWFADS